MNFPSNCDYLAYLLHLWRAETYELWQVTLENPYTGEIVAFPSPAALSLSCPKNNAQFAPTSR